MTIKSDIADTAPTGQSAEGEATQAPFFDVVLYPHRSLPKRMFRHLILAIILLCGIAITRFIAVGAWPVVIFVVVDIAAIYLAFYLNYRSGRLHEVVQLTRRDLLITRVQPNGRTRSWRFEPYWARVLIETVDADTNQLVVTSHGERLVIGDFLTPSERRALARDLNDAIARWRAD